MEKASGCFYDVCGKDLYYPHSGLAGPWKSRQNEYPWHRGEQLDLAAAARSAHSEIRQGSVGSYETFRKSELGCTESAEACRKEGGKQEIRPLSIYIIQNTQNMSINYDTLEQLEHKFNNIKKNRTKLSLEKTNTLEV